MDDNQLKAAQKKLEILNLHNIIRSFIKENISIDVEEERMGGYDDKTKRFAIKLIMDGEVLSETSILL